MIPDSRKCERNGAFYIQLPMEWCKDHNITTTEDFFIDKEPESEDLTIYPKLKLNENKTYDTFPVIIEKLESDDSEYLQQIMIGVVINGYRRISFIGEPNEKNRDNIEHAKNWFLNNSTIVVRGNKITACSEKECNKEIFIHHNPEVHTRDIIISMIATAKEMLKYVYIALKKSNFQYIEEIKSLDNQLDSCHWFVHRQTSLILMSISPDKRTTPISAMQTYLISRALEGVGDHAEKMCKEVKKIIEIRDHTPDYKSISSIGRLIESSISLFDAGIDAYLLTEDLSEDSPGERTRKIREALIKTQDRVFKRFDNFEAECQNAVKEIIENEKDIKIAVPLSRIIESIQHIGDLSVEISTSTINKVVKEKLELDQDDILYQMPGSYSIEKGPII